MATNEIADLMLRLDSYALGPPEGQQLMREASKALEALQAENAQIRSRAVSYGASEEHTLFGGELAALAKYAQ